MASYSYIVFCFLKTAKPLPDLVGHTVGAAFGVCAADDAVQRPSAYAPTGTGQQRCRIHGGHGRLLLVQRIPEQLVLHHGAQIGS